MFLTHSLSLFLPTLSLSVSFLSPKIHYFHSEKGRCPRQFRGAHGYVCGRANGMSVVYTLAGRSVDVAKIKTVIRSGCVVCAWIMLACLLCWLAACVLLEKYPHYAAGPQTKK